eukprot:10508738-Heterocapsa_arctica.AAC.1
MRRPSNVVRRVSRFTPIHLSRDPASSSAQRQRLPGRRHSIVDARSRKGQELGEVALHGSSPMFDGE